MYQQVTYGRLFAVVASCALLAVGLVSSVAADKPKEEKPPTHNIPADKGLSADWIQGLYEGRQRQVWSAREAEALGMPVGGIGAGQLYLLSDGTLAKWRIFNTYIFTGYGDQSYEMERPESPVASGFAVAVEAGGETQVRRLSREGFGSCEFAGEYPIGLVRYADQDCPVRVELEAFSPFIPGRAHDSALPATCFDITVVNTSAEPVTASVLGWLENAVCRNEVINLGDVGWRGQHTSQCRNPEAPLQARRRSRVVAENERTMLVHSIERTKPHPDRPAILYEDFEGEDFGEWEVEGNAFSEGPTCGAVLWQRRLNGWIGKGLANSYLVVHDEDGLLDRKKSMSGSATGSLTSPEFTIERDYITFYIGKGDVPGETCMNLLIDGDVVRTATGSPNDRWAIMLHESLGWYFWDVSEFAGKTARLQIVDACRKRAKGHQKAEICVDHIVFCDLGGLRSAGTMALALAGRAGDAEALLRAAKGLPENLHAEPDVAYPAEQRRCGALATEGAKLAPGEKHTFSVVLSWYFPNHPHGREYANRFGSAPEVAAHILDRRDRLAGKTRLWHKTFYEDSTLPRWLLFRLHAPVSNLATNTVQWRGNRRLWGWEGAGCCRGTCTHVYNYAHAHAFLFPELARSVREMQDFGAGFHKETGLVGYRAECSGYAADGQCGAALKAYREHRMSADDTFLKRNWPRIKKALEYSIGRDGNEDGLIEDDQHNTYDMRFYGPNTFVGSLYLAALRAGEEMAERMGEEEFAQRCARIHESGRRLTMERLWDGRYFIQRAELQKDNKTQYGRGCLSDQLFGQSWAHLLGLGHLYPPDAVAKTYRSIWTYNWAPSVGPYQRTHGKGRVYAEDNDAGLFTCTWPVSDYIKRGVNYQNEVWTGIEYQVAGGMIWEGMVEEGLAICRGIHDRYDPAKRNPFNEVECGDHYARALASWGVYHALLGYEHDGPAHYIGFAPRLSPEDFAAAFTAAEGWGLFRQIRRDGRQENKIEVRCGELPIRTLALDVPKGTGTDGIAATVAGKPVAVKARIQDSRLVLTFPATTLAEGQLLKIVIEQEP